MLILIDGPEKAGKTTFVKALADSMKLVGYNVEIVPQGPWNPNDAHIAPKVKEHSQSDKVFIWDRGWPSEAVYATLLNRQRRANNNPFLMEWLHGRSTPYKFIMLPMDQDQLGKRRDNTDLPVDYVDEYNCFAAYKQYGYRLLWNDYTSDSTIVNLESVYGMIQGNPLHKHVYGNPNSDFWFVAAQNEGCKFDRWMPLSYNAAYEAFDEVLGEKAFKCAYMFARIGSPAGLTANKIITAIGQEAAEWVRYYAPATEHPKLHRLRNSDMQGFRSHLLHLKELIP